MASGSLILYTAGTILLALGFAAHVAHAVLPPQMKLIFSRLVREISDQLSVRRP